MTEIEILNNSQLGFIQNAIYTVVMTSCSKDSANPTLVGKWQLVSYDYKIGTISAPINITAADYVEFKTNGTVLTSISGQSKVFLIQ